MLENSLELLTVRFYETNQSKQSFKYGPFGNSTLTA